MLSMLLSYVGGSSGGVNPLYVLSIYFMGQG